LIQHVLAVRGDVHVVFVTDGENNPWPQRYMERKVFLKAGDRAKWGAMRRREALCSLARLGMSERSATFLAFPDQGIANLARRADMRLRDAFREIIENIQPTLIVSPSSFDLHADHRAISYYAHSAAPDATITTYVIHGNAPEKRLACHIELTNCEQQRKQEAIECHVSQLALSRNRFLSYARRTESFHTAEFDLVRVESVARVWMTAFEHSVRVLFGAYPRNTQSGVQTAADVQDRAESSL